MTLRRTRTTIVAITLALGIFLALAGSASAVVLHEHESTFSLTGLNRISVDNSAGPSHGRLYIGELDLLTTASRVYQADASGGPTGVELDGSGTPAGTFGFFQPPNLAAGPAVDSSGGANAGRIYVPDLVHGVVDLFGEGGEYVCQITGAATPSASECAGVIGSETPTGGLEPLSVAVDPSSGEVAVGDASGVVYLFDETGTYKGRISEPHITKPGSLAYDSGGRLYVVNSSLGVEGSAVRYSSAGAFELQVASQALSVGVDLSDDHVYLTGAENTQVEEFDAAGTQVTSFGAGGYSADVNSSTRQVYLGRVLRGEIWSGPIFVPNVTTGEAEEVKETSATVKGTVDPEVTVGGSQVESCQFEFGPTTSYGQTAPCTPDTPYVDVTEVIVALTDLAPSITYHYRLAAENEEGRTGRGEDRTFTTFGPPRINGERSIARTQSATVEAQVNPYGYDTTCEVQFVADALYDPSAADPYSAGGTAPCEDAIDAGFGGQPARAGLTGLTIGTIYHYRFVARNSAESEGAAKLGTGTEAGEDQVFSTFGIESFSLELLDEAGNPYLSEATGQPYVPAGGHPYQMKVRFRLATTGALTSANPGSGTANMRTVRIQLPPGLIGNPNAVEKCPAYLEKLLRCAPEALVGSAEIQTGRGTHEAGEIYNLVPPEGVAAQLGGHFNSIGIVRINADVRSGSDYGVNATTLSIAADDIVTSVEVTLWGVPGEGGAPFLSNPTSCIGPLTSTLRVDAWQEPGNFVSKDATLPAVEGCDQLDFSPTLEARPTTNVADSPSGLNVNLHVPQDEAPCEAGPPVACGLAEAHLKDATVTLPEGLVVNPSGANGLDACTAAQIGYKPGTSGPAEFTPGPAECPDASRIGNVEIDTPLLDHPLPGSVYVAKPYDNPFDSLLALYIAVYDPVSGVVVKLPGHVVADPNTGQLTTTFQENPQLPFEDLKLKLFGGAAAPLRTPPACGTYSTMSSLTPWSAPESGPPATPFDSYTLTQGPNGTCANTAANQPFDPGFDAGTITPIAGSYSPLVIHLRREDGSQQFSQLTVTPPPGLLGKLAGVPYCPEAAIAAAAKKSGSAEKASPSCPAASHVGVVEVGAGAGPAPYWVQGQAYLAGPYEGAPLSLAILTPATAGPFDLGTVVTRVALKVDPETAQITAVSDPIPSILEGIPLDIRTISVKLDRPEFTLNPTSCDPMQVGGAAVSILGQSAPLTDPFQVGECAPLGFKPKLALRLEGGSTRGKHPALRATLRMPPGGANIARAVVSLPRSEFLDQGHIRTICTRVQFSEGACPAGSIYGHARAFSPLLDKPLEGPVYLRSSSHKLPDLVAALNGQIQIVLVGRIDSVRGGIRTTFEAVPDAPVSKFVLEMQGGHKGLLQNSTDVCASTNRATAKFNAQNGKVSDTEPAVKAQCAKPHRKAGKAG